MYYFLSKREHKSNWCCTVSSCTYFSPMYTVCLIEKMVSFAFRSCDTGVVCRPVTDLSSQLSGVRRRGSQDAETGKSLKGVTWKSAYKCQQLLSYQVWLKCTEMQLEGEEARKKTLESSTFPADWFRLFDVNKTGLHCYNLLCSSQCSSGYMIWIRKMKVACLFLPRLLLYGRFRTAYNCWHTLPSKSYILRSGSFIPMAATTPQTSFST